MKIKYKKGFTLVELIVVIAVLGILILIGTPRFVGYLEKTQLIRIQHDTKIMEQEMEQILIEDERKIGGWQDNGKELGVLVMQEKLFEKEGVAKNVDKRHLANAYSARNIALSEDSELGTGGDLYNISEQSSTSTLTDEERDGDGYKIVPNSYKGKIRTKLKGTFYSNELGKVYYENEKPLSVEKDAGISCESPEALPDYEFDHSTGTIIKWNGNQEHLVIPFAFKNTDTGECTTVRIIGRGAFMQGGFKSIVIPDTVVKIEEDAFKDNELTEINIPHSVVEVEDGAFDNNFITPESGDYGNKDTTFEGGKEFEQNGEEGNETITPEYKAPSAEDVGVIFNPETGTIVSGDSQDTGKPSKPELTQEEITIPNEINVGGEEIPVKNIAKGAYQGLGLKSVVLPSGLERIEDYAFAGNQLIGVTTPGQVSYIGNYAFAFNEQTHSENKSKRATIKSIKIKNGAALEEQFSKLDKYGNIQNGGIKADKVGIAQLKNFIFVTSIDNYVIDEEYVGSNPIVPGQPSEPSIPGTDDSIGIYSEEEIENLIAEGYEKVETTQDLSNVKNDSSSDKKYIQTKNIDLSGYSSGAGWEPIGSLSKEFSGVYDGGGFTVIGLNINRPTESNLGFFGYTKKAEIKNITLKNVDVTGDSLIGGLVGSSDESSNISNISVTGSVTGISDVGGLAGKNYSGSILNSHSGVNVTGSKSRIGGLVGTNESSIQRSYFTGTVKDTGAASQLGGLVGLNDGGVKDSYSTGSVTGYQIVGGLVGENEGYSDINTTYAAGPVNGSKRTSGLVGYNSFGYVTRSYYDEEVSGQSYVPGGLENGKGLGKSTERMKLKSTYIAWSETIWNLKDGEYPTLKNVPQSN